MERDGLLQEVGGTFQSTRRVQPPIVSVYDVDFRFLDAIANSERRAKIPVSAHRQRLSLESRSLRALKKWRSRRREYQRVVHPAAQSFGQQENLTLTSTPFAAGVDMKNSKPLQPSSSCAAKARKIPRSHGSGELFISSGCHCT